MGLKGYLHQDLIAGMVSERNEMRTHEIGVGDGFWLV